MKYLSELLNRGALVNSNVTVSTAAVVSPKIPTPDDIKEIGMLASNDAIDKVQAAIANGYKFEAVGSFDPTTVPYGSVVAFIEMKSEMFADADILVHAKAGIKEMALRHFPREKIVVVDDDFIADNPDGLDFKFMVRADRMWMVMAMPIGITE